jgi:hypothetical protein
MPPLRGWRLMVLYGLSAWNVYSEPYRHAPWQSNPTLEGRLAFPQELAHDFFHVSALAIHRVIEGAHVIIGNLAGEFGERLAQFRMA